MKKNPLANQLLEGTHYSTKIRQIDEQAGTRRIKSGVKTYKKMIENLLNPDHPTPNPASDLDKKMLQECMVALDAVSEHLNKVKTLKKKK